jgi:serine/threonine protein kinase
MVSNKIVGFIMMPLHPLRDISYRKASTPPLNAKYTMSPTLNNTVNVRDKISLLLKVFGPNTKVLSQANNETGAIYQVILTHDMIEHLADYEKHFVDVKGMRVENLPTQNVIIKLVVTPYSSLKRTVYNEIKREITIHNNLWNKVAPVKIFDKTYDVRKVIPEFFYGAYASDFGIIIMEHLPGNTLFEILRPLAPHIPAPRIENWMVAKLEYALCCLYLAGYIHADLHARNIYTDPHAQSIYILDFGRTITMTRELIKEFKMYLINRQDSAITDFWRDHVQSYGNAAIKARRNKTSGVAQEWWSNVEVLQKIATERRGHHLDALRKKTWIPQAPQSPRAETFREMHQRKKRERELAETEEGELAAPRSKKGT